MENKIVLGFLGVLILSVLFTGMAFLLLNNKESTITTIFENNIDSLRVSNAQVLEYQGATLTDHSSINGNYVTANNLGMGVSVYPAYAQDIDGKGIVQYINFTWNGNQQQNIGWIFHYGEELEKFKVEVLSDINYQYLDSKIVYKKISVLGYNNYYNLGSPDGSCQIGSENSSKMFNLEFGVENVTLGVENVTYCFDNGYLQTSELEGYFKESFYVQKTRKGWKDVSNKIEYIGSNIAGNAGEFYKIDNSTFMVGENKETRWTFTAKQNSKAGKWGILGYDSDLGIVPSLSQNKYIYLDPWWNSDWSYKRELSNLSNTISSFYNITYDVNMKADFSDLRFTDSLDLVEINYTIIDKVDSTHARIRVDNNNETSIFMYYGNVLAIDNGNFSKVYIEPSSSYTFDDGSLLDFSGNGNTLTNNGASKTSNGIIGDAFIYDGATTYMSLPSGTYLDETNDWTISLWANPSSVSSGIFFSNRNSLTSSDAIVLGYSGAGNIAFIMRDSLGTNLKVLSSSLGGVANVWYHVAVSFNSATNEMKLYVNGAEFTDTFTGSVDMDIASIGNTEPYNQFFNGTIDELHIFPRVLTTNEINQLIEDGESNFTLGSENVYGGEVIVDLNSPENEYRYFSAQSTNLVFNLSSPVNFIQNYTLYVRGISQNAEDITTTTIYYPTINVTEVFLEFEAFSPTIEDTYTWWVESCNIANFCRNSTFRNLIYDSSPTIEFITPTPDNATLLTNTNNTRIEYNITGGIATSVNITLWTGAGALYDNFISTSQNDGNDFTLLKGNYTYYINATASTGNSGFTETRNLEYNPTPNITFILPTPLNDTTINLFYIPISYNITSGELGNVTINIYNDGGIVQSYFSTADTDNNNFSVANGNYTYNITAYSYEGSVAFSTTRVVEKLGPEITNILISPANATITSQPTNTFIGNSSSFYDLENISLYMWNSTGKYIIQTDIPFGNIELLIYDITDLVTSGSSIDAGNPVLTINSYVNHTDMYVTDTTCVISRARYNYENGSSLDVTAGNVVGTPLENQTAINPWPAEVVSNVQARLSRSGSSGCGTGAATVQDTWVFGNVTTKEYNLSVTTSIAYNETTFWNIEGCDSTGFCDFAVSNYTIFSDTTLPIITITQPTDTFVRTTGDNTTLAWSVVEDNIDVCWYGYDGINSSTMSCTASPKYFNYTGGVDTITLWANDTWGNIGEKTYTFNASLRIISETYETEVVETTTTPFYINIAYTSADWTTFIPQLWYNGTGYTATPGGSGDNITATTTITIPTITLPNETTTFYWNLSLTNATGTFYFQTTTHNQTISEVTFGLCGIGETPFLNFTTRDAIAITEELNTTFKSNWQIYAAGGDGSIIKNESYQDLTETNSNYPFCLSPNSSSYTVSFQTLADASTHTPTNYYLTDSVFDGTTQDIDMYLLNDSSATLTQIKVVNRAYQGVEDVLVFVQRYDIGTDTYYTVDMAKTADDGTDLIYMQWYDIWYRFVLVQGGTTVKTTTPKKMSETPEVIELFGDFEYSFSKFNNIEYILEFNNVTENFVLTYTLPSAEVTSACLEVLKRNVTDDYEICNVCETSSSATMYCNIAAEGNGTFIANFYATGSLAKISWIIEAVGIPRAVYDILGNEEATTFAILIAGIVLSFFLFSPIAGVIGMLLGVGAGMALGFQPIDFTAYLGLCTVGGILIYLMKK